MGLQMFELYCSRFRGMSVRSGDGQRGETEENDRQESEFELEPGKVLRAGDAMQSDYDRDKRGLEGSCVRSH